MPSFKIGYARVSTDDQDMSLQREALAKYGVDRIIEEHASGKTVKRRQLANLFRAMRPGDAIVVWKLDRLGRTLTGVLEVVERIKSEGVELISLTEQIDTNSAMGRAFIQIALVFAELERNLISERTKAGIAAKRAAGQRFGRLHMIRDYPKRLAKLREMDEAGKLRDPEGGPLVKAIEVVKVLNEADPKAPRIKSPETVRRWWREGYRGLDGDVVIDVPLSEIEERN